jgi:hypothetical protein
MARKSTKPKDERFEENLFWFLAAAYMADCLGLLDTNKRLKLTHLADQYGCADTWQRQVEEALDLDRAFVEAVFRLCTERGKTPPQAIGFILRGLGCPEPEVRIVEALS